MRDRQRIAGDSPNRKLTAQKHGPKQNQAVGDVAAGKMRQL